MPAGHVEAELAEAPESYDFQLRSVRLRLSQHRDVQPVLGGPAKATKEAL